MYKLLHTEGYNLNCSPALQFSKSNNTGQRAAHDVNGSVTASA